jgi:hypothetical protein
VPHRAQLALHARHARWRHGAQDVRHALNIRLGYAHSKG